ncbi:hypothetical protein LV89_04519 [Arcicella aurantiaca]|uniref:Uncharacterized protein n=1 Tax=Arcicella aurantiaca TaxID=591202 RepID=A0A316DHE2_9BACT|nr:hypothetical protein [Arcicella aurantiaca]PWK17068.1 hypothetical protein LV89_04519 [Arcicella aurantiaca]
MTKPTHLSKPMTRHQVAETLGICSKTLSRFFEKEGVKVEPRTLLKPKLVELIIKKYHGEEVVSD